LKKIFLTRLKYWAERYEILSPTLYCFRRETIDCVLLLSTAIQSSFERKEQTLVDFLDISGDYDNVLIDLLCERMHQAQLPLKIVRVMWNLLWRKKVVFYYEGKPMMESVRLKGLPQESTLSPFSYGIYTSEADRFLPARCNMPTTWLYTPLTMMLETFSELFNLLAQVSMVFSGGLGS
jgi:hypothetical protein